MVAHGGVARGRSDRVSRHLGGDPAHPARGARKCRRADRGGQARGGGRRAGAETEAEEEIAGKRAEFNREFDRREIEIDVKLREIRSHEESLALLDISWNRQERLTGKTPP